jgi:hypothetical protein
VRWGGFVTRCFGRGLFAGLVLSPLIGCAVVYWLYPEAIRNPLWFGMIVVGVLLLLAAGRFKGFSERAGTLRGVAIGLLCFVFSNGVGCLFGAAFFLIRYRQRGLEDDLEQSILQGVVGIVLALSTGFIIKRMEGYRR